MRFGQACASAAMAAALAAAVQPAGAVSTYEFTGSVTSIPVALQGGGLGVGDPVHLFITVGPAVPDTDPAASVGVYPSVITMWALDIGSFATLGSGGDVLVCDSPIPGQDNCGSGNVYGWWSGIWAGKDGVRFVTKQLTSAPMVLNGYTQSCWGAASNCVNANVYDDSATALTGTDIPALLDPVVFGSSTNNGRVLFGPGPVLFSVALVPEPTAFAMLTAGLGVVALMARRRRR